ncbi:MAG TPA: leucine-rich repeat domain-containing protein [Candidatus Angelobacter sp.]|nr:leucine-rich repeat domain-containing protein [Candidatus Angelobacter sp.]
MKDTPPWMRAALIFSLPLLVLIFQVIPAVLEQRRKNQLTEITGNLQSGYFSLRPREDEASFKRADGEHQEILQWLQKGGGILYLTGLSGTGKSSLLSAWVLPHLKEQNVQVIRLRGYQDPLAVLQHELLQPGVIWQKPPSEAMEMRALLERVCRYIRPQRLLVVFDQFEEFVILQNQEIQQGFKQLLASLLQDPIEDLTFLLVFRSDYIGLVEKLRLSPLIQDTNWKEVSPFTQRAAQEFLQGSGLEINEKILQDVLREAAEIERTKGIIRPITINLCGLVLGRFAAGLPKGFRPGALIPGFIRESVLLPELRDVAPKVIPHLINSHVTKQPRTIAELARSSALEPEAVLGCLRRLGQSNRSIVRPLDAKQELWEISHDFLVPLLDSIVARWRASFWKRVRSWLPLMTAASMVLVVVLISNWQKDPIAQLTELGWTVTQTDKGLSLSVSGIPPKESLEALQRIPKKLSISLDTIDPTISEWRVLKNLTAIEIGYGVLSARTTVTDLKPLKELNSLTTLKLGYTKVSDLVPLARLKNLNTLILTYTKVSDVEPLKELKNLTTLDLSGTVVSDLEPLKDLRNLSKLNLVDTRVRDLRPLKEMENLKELYLGTEVSDLGPLRNLKDLTKLGLSYTQVSDLEPLSGLKNLKYLALENTRVSDVRPLQNLKNLTTLYLGYTQVSDIEPLKGLKNLTTLYIDHTQMSEASMTQLRSNLPNLIVYRER